MRATVTPLQRALSAVDRRLARSRRATIGGWIAGGVPVLLLTTTRRHSGNDTSTPLLFHRTSDGALLVAAVNGAADWNPDWLHNLTVQPCVTVEIDGVSTTGQAAVLDENQRVEAWTELGLAFPGLIAAQQACRRTIPIIRITPDPSASTGDAHLLPPPLLQRDIR